MQTSDPVRPPVPTTNPTAAMLNVFVTLALFLVSFIGFLIAPWLVLGLGALLYTVRQTLKNRKRGAGAGVPEADGAIRSFGLGAAE